MKLERFISFSSRSSFTSKTLCKTLRYETDKSATTLAEGGMEESKNYKF